jgi:hypothetical protein
LLLLEIFPDDDFKGEGREGGRRKRLFLPSFVVVVVVC